MFTLFHLLVLLGLCGGFIVGMVGGAMLFGVVGGIVGALAGACLGLFVGYIPAWLTLRWFAKDLIAKTSAELRASLHGPEFPLNLVLLELQSRGEDIRQDLPVVLELLASEDFGRRCRGWAALTSAFPELAAQMGDYRVGDGVDECRRKVEELKLSGREAAEGL